MVKKLKETGSLERLAWCRTLVGAHIDTPPDKMMTSDLAPWGEFTAFLTDVITASGELPSVLDVVATPFKMRDYYVGNLTLSVSVAVEGALECLIEEGFELGDLPSWLRNRYRSSSLAIGPQAPEGDPAESLKFKNWTHREMARLVSNYYEALPFLVETDRATAIHFAHISRQSPRMIAFTADVDKGERDIQTTMKPGRYLTKFYSGIGAEEINRLACMIGPEELKFAITAEEIERVYRAGPSSCMSKPRTQYDCGSEHHPVHVYGDSDVRLAYLEKNSKITARALVWPEKKRHCRIYGDSARLGRTLHENGYRCGSLEGAKLKRIDLSDGRIVAPYFDDGGHRGTIEADHLVIDEDGEWSFEGVEGVVYVEQDDNDTFHCENCGDDHDVDAVSSYTLADTEETWCHHCVDNDAYCCDFSGAYYASDRDFVTVWRRPDTKERWHSSVVNQSHAIYRCDGTGDYYFLSRYSSVDLEDGRTVSLMWFGDHGVTVDGKHYEQGTEPDDPDQLDPGLTPEDDLPPPTYSLPVTLLTADPDVGSNRHWRAIAVELCGGGRHSSTFDPTGGYRGITYLGNFHNIEEALELEPVL